jgi:hypothetical protein
VDEAEFKNRPILGVFSLNAFLNKYPLSLLSSIFSSFLRALIRKQKKKRTTEKQVIPCV